MQCPQCQGSITIEASHYGALFTCPICTTVFFVDWNGVPEAPEAAGTEASSQNFSNFSSAEPASNFDSPASTQNPESTSSFDAPMEPQAHESISNVDSSPSFGHQEFGPSSFSLTDTEPEKGSGSIAGATDSFVSDGPEVLYDLVISGLDVKSSWDPVKDVLQDPRLKLDVRALERKIKNGRLSLTKQSPLVVFYIVQKIKSFNVKIHWTVHEDK